MNGERPYLSVVIPSYNEEDRLTQHVPSLVTYLKQQGKPFEIIVVNDGSKDRTAAVTRELAKQYPMVRLIDLNPNRGKGGAVRAGMLDARGRFVLFTDADQATPIDQVEKLLPKLDGEGYDVAIGSRYMPGSDVQRAQVWHRALLGRLFRITSRLLCIRGIADTQCGFKAMTYEAAQKVFTQVTSNSPIFDVEMLILAIQEGYRIAELPVKWVHHEATRIPYNMSRAWHTWWELLRIRSAHGVVWPLKVRL